MSNENGQLLFNFMPKTSVIFAGLDKKDTNKPAIMNGQKGFWVQGQCVWVKADRAVFAISKYREELSNNRIACHHNLNCDAILNRL